MMLSSNKPLLTWIFTSNVHNHCQRLIVFHEAFQKTLTEDILFEHVWPMWDRICTEFVHYKMSSILNKIDLSWKGESVMIQNFSISVYEVDLDICSQYLASGNKLRPADFSAVAPWWNSPWGKSSFEHFLREIILWAFFEGSHPLSIFWGKSSFENFLREIILWE